MEKPHRGPEGPISFHQRPQAVPGDRGMRQHYLMTQFRLPQAAPGEELSAARASVPPTHSFTLSQTLQGLRPVKLRIAPQPCPAWLTPPSRLHAIHSPPATSHSTVLPLPETPAEATTCTVPVCSPLYNSPRGVQSHTGLHQPE